MPIPSAACRRHSAEELEILTPFYVVSPVSLVLPILPGLRQVRLGPRFDLQLRRLENRSGSRRRGTLKCPRVSIR